MTSATDCGRLMRSSVWSAAGWTVLAVVISAAVPNDVRMAGQEAAAPLAADQIPMAQGVTLVQAVSGDQKQGDYEATLTVLPASADGVTIQSRAFVVGDNGQRQWLSILRRVRRADLQDAPLQVLGFDTNDAEVIAGATAIGPSLAVVRNLVHGGRADHVIRNYASRRDNRGTLARVSTIQFPVLVNGVRVTVPAVVARGQLGIPTSCVPGRCWSSTIRIIPSR